MRRVDVTKQLATAADPDGICLSQTTGPGDLTINGAFAVGGVATLDTARRVAITSAGNISGSFFTITGTDERGETVSDLVQGPNATTTFSLVDFVTITQVSVNNAMAAAGEVGTNGVGSTLPIPLDQFISPFNASLYVFFQTGTVANVTAQFTFDDVFNNAPPYDWRDHVDLTAITASEDGTFISPVSACRLLVNSGTDAVVLRVLQAGVS